MPSIFEERAKALKSKNIFEERAKVLKSEQEAPATLKGAASAYGSGFGGGAQGLPQDVLSLTKPVQPFFPGLTAAQNLADLSGLKTTHAGTEALQAQRPQNSLERILQTSGQFGGQEAILGAALGGPVGGALGTAHGSASGALYAGLKELGVPEEYALGVTALATVSPIAAQKFIAKLKSGKSFPQVIKELPLEEANIITGTSEAAIPSAGSSTFKIGKELPFGPEKEAVSEEAFKQLQKPVFEAEKTSQVSLPKEEAKSLEGRVSKEIEPAETISKEKFFNEKHGGIESSGKVKSEAKAKRKLVTKAYKNAEKVYDGQRDIFPKLANETAEAIDRLKLSAKNNPGEQAVLTQLEALQKLIGTEQGLIETPLERLIKTSDSLSGSANFEVPYTGPKEILKQFSKKINEAVLGSLESKGLNADAMRQADKKYSKFANRFLNDEISPFLERNIRNPEALYRKATRDEGVYRALKDAVGESNSKLIDKIDRAIAEDRLSKFTKDTSKIGSPEFKESIANLEGLIGKEKTRKIKDHLFSIHKIPRPSVSKEQVTSHIKLKERVTSATQNKIAESIAKSPEQIKGLLDTPRGIRTLREDLKKRGKLDLFDKLSEEKILHILKEGKVEGGKLTGTKLHGLLNKSENYKIFSEIYGEEPTRALLIDAKKAKSSELVTETLIELAKLGVKYSGAGKLVQLFNKVI